MSFRQEPPQLGNQYETDRALRSYLRRALPPEVLEEVEPELLDLGELSGGALYRMQLEDRLHEPRSRSSGSATTPSASCAFKQGSEAGCPAYRPAAFCGSLWQRRNPVAKAHRSHVRFGRPRKTARRLRRTWLAFGPSSC